MSTTYDYQWFTTQLNCLPKKKPYRIFRKGNNEWVSIISADKWKKINFHFEVRWSNHKPISETTKLNIRIHLESQFISEEIDRKARAFFAKHGYAIKGNTFKDLPGEKLEKSVLPDFSSEEAAKRTIQEIIDIFDSPAYQKCAELAEEFIDGLEKE